LSLRITISGTSAWPASFRPSNASPPVSAPSPTSAIAAFLPAQAFGARNAEGGEIAVLRAGVERVVFALFALGKTAEAVFLPERAEGFRRPVRILCA
jgi:hypothetical protein